MSYPFSYLTFYSYIDQFRSLTQQEAREAESTVEATESGAGTLRLLRFGTIFIGFRLLRESSGIRLRTSSILFHWLVTRKLSSEEAGNTLLPSEKLILSTEVTQHSCHLSSAKSATTSSSATAANADTLSRRVERGTSTRSSDSTASTSTFCPRNRDRFLQFLKTKTYSVIISCCSNICGQIPKLPRKARTTNLKAR